MIFNSLIFFAFLAVVYPLVMLLRQRVALRNAVLLISSYFFYGWWDWRFLPLIAFTTVFDYCCALGMSQSFATTTTPRGMQVRKLLLTLSIVSNLSILGFFKYFGFFVSSTSEALAYLQIPFHPGTLNIVLPVGISFYTFQTMSYTIDVYRDRIDAEKNLLTFATFLAFFPQLVAGPIERACHLIPQFRNATSFSFWGFYSGSYLIGWGLFKKVVIADNVSRVADSLFASPDPGGLDVAIGVVAFSIQIYTDFSGYSDIACGLSRCMGFDLMSNFAQPFFAMNPSDFWRRWHISLSTWLRDYLYIPLGGNRNGNFKTNRNLLITMLLGGLWHGAAWNYVAWGTYHGLLLVGHRIVKPLLDAWVIPTGRMSSAIWFAFRWFSFFLMSCAGWLLFRAESMHQVWVQMSALITAPMSRKILSSETDLLALLVCAVALFSVELVQEQTHDRFWVFRLNFGCRAVVYASLMLSFIIYGNFSSASFIYFQF
jgi:alginate O-acetyltransferase complex protein AlgI